MAPKFSIQIENQFGYDWSQIKHIVEQTEKYGYYSFYTCDHFFLDNDSTNRNALEAWTILTAAAGISKNLKLGTLVTGNNYRNPALLAKIAASLDMISGGRMEFGIGTGWKQIEYEAYGYTFPSVKDRMDMLEESVQIIKSLWTKPRTTFEGKHYTIQDAVFAPKPVQNAPMVMIGGNGEKRLLKLVAQYADYMNLFFLPIQEVQQKLDALKGHCQTVGRDYEEVGKSIFTRMHVEETQEDLDTFIEKQAKYYNTTPEAFKQRVFNPDYPGAWIGLPEDIRDRIDYMNGLGFDYYFIQMPIDLSTDIIEKLSTLVFQKYFK